MQEIQLGAEIPSELNGKRLDQALAVLFAEHSRSRLKEWIENGQVLVNGVTRRPRDKVAVGDEIAIKAEQDVLSEWTGEDLPLDIIYEDEHILVINKPANLVVHPAAGNRKGTLVNALLHYCPDLAHIPRAGVVHRLDKDTTGLMVVAKTLSAQTHLVNQLQKRAVKRIYETVVYGVLTAGGTITEPIARHPKDRTRMAVVEGGKPAVTHYRLIEKFKHHTHLRIQLETGRTHQIRVHMAYLQHPVIGDKVYGSLRMPPKAPMSVQHVLRAFPRQALHARNLGLIHPMTEQEMSWESPLNEDMKNLINILKQPY